MQNAHRQQEVVYQLTQWAEHQDSVRAMLLTSTRASPHAQVDVFSDYDVILVVRDIRPFFENRAWLQDFGQVLVSYWDPIQPKPDYDIEQVSNVIQYVKWHDPVKLDRFGCEYFLPLIEETTHEAQSKQTPQCRANYPHFTASRWEPNGGRDLSRA